MDKDNRVGADCGVRGLGQGRTIGGNWDNYNRTAIKNKNLQICRVEFKIPDIINLPSRRESITPHSLSVAIQQDFQRVQLGKWE